MKKFLLPLAAVAAVAVAAPAFAQPYGYGYGYGQPIGYNFTSPAAHIDQKVKRLSILIDRSAQQGEVSRYQAQMLRQELRGVAQLDNRYGRGGMSGREFQALDARLDAVQSHLQQMRNANGTRYGAGYYPRW